MKEIKKQKNIIIMMTMGIVLPFYLSGPLFLLAWIGLLWGNRQNLIGLTRALWKWWLFILSSLIGAVLNGSVLASLMPVAFIIYLYYFAIYRQLVTKDLYLRLMKILVYGSSFASLFNLFNYGRYAWQHGLSPFFLFSKEGRFFRAESTFFNANYFGLYLVMVMMVGLFLASIEIDKKKKWIWIGINGLNLISLLLTQSRMVFPCVLVGIFVYMALYQPKWLPYIMGVGLGGGLLLMMNPQLLPRFTSLAYGFQDRWQIWQVGFQIFLTRPLLGRGAFAYYQYYYLFTNEVKMHAHQFLIDSLANYGMIGFMFVVYAAFPFIKEMLKGPQNREDKPYFALVWAVLASVLCHGLFDVSLIWLQTAYVFLLIVGYGTGSAKS